MVLGRLPKKIFQNWNLSQSRNSAQSLGLGIVQDPANQARFTIPQTDFVLNFLLSNDGLADAADARLVNYGGNLHADLQSHFAVGVHVRRDINIHADIQVLKLSVYQGVNTHATDSRLERPCRYRHALADLERGLLVIERAHLGIL